MSFVSEGTLTISLKAMLLIMASTTSVEVDRGAVDFVYFMGGWLDDVGIGGMNACLFFSSDS